MSSLRPGKTAHLFPNARAATAAFVTKRRFWTLRLTSSLPISQLSLSLPLLVELGGLGTVYGSRCVWWGNDFLWPTPGEPQVWLDERGWTCFSPPRRHILALPIRGQHLFFFPFFFKRGSVLIIVSDEQFFLFLFRNTKVKLKQSCFNFGLTGLDWLRFGWKKKWGLVVGCWDPSNLKCGHTNESTRRRTKEVLFVFYHYLLSRKRRKGGREKRKELLQHDRETSGRGQLWNAHQSDLWRNGSRYFYLFFSLPNRNKKRISSGKTTLKRWLSPIFFYFFRDRLENSAPSQIKEKNTPDQSFYFHSKCGQKENPNASSSPRAATEQLK